ncbi:hypothetical protein ACLOJK_019212 [Asimina triloba]
MDYDFSARSSLLNGIPSNRWSLILYQQTDTRKWAFIHESIITAHAAQEQKTEG